MTTILVKSVEALRITFAAPITTTSITTPLTIIAGTRQGALVNFHVTIPGSVKHLTIV